MVEQPPTNDSVADVRRPTESGGLTFNSIVGDPREMLAFIQQQRQQPTQNDNFLTFTPLPGQDRFNPATALAAQSFNPAEEVAGQCFGPTCFRPPLEVVPRPLITPTDQALERAPLRAVSPEVTRAREEFMRAVMANPPAGMTQARLTELCNQFETRMMALGHTRSLLAGDATQGHAGLNERLVSSYQSMLRAFNTSDADAPGQIWNQAQRRERVMNLLYYAANPTDQDQGVQGGTFGRDGSNGSCWAQAGRIAGMCSRPDVMIDYATQLMLTGEYRRGATVVQRLTDQQRRAMQIEAGSPEAGWTVANARTTNARSPVGLLFDRGFAFMLNRPMVPNPDNPNAPWMEHRGSFNDIRNAMRNLGFDNLPFGSNPQTTEADRRRMLMECGAYIVFQPGRDLGGGRRGPGHLRTNQLVYNPADRTWRMVEDNQHGTNSDVVGNPIPGLAAWLRGADRTVRHPGGVQPFGPGDFCPRPGPPECRIPGGPFAPGAFDRIMDEFQVPQRTRQFILGLLRLIISRCFSSSGGGRCYTPRGGGSWCV